MKWLKEFFTYDGKIDISAIFTTLAFIISLVLIVVVLTSCTTNPKIVYIPVATGCAKPKISPSSDYPPLAANTPSAFVKWCIAGQVMCRSEVKALRETIR